MSANKAMMERATDSLYKTRDGMNWEALIAVISRMNDEKRAERILSDLVEMEVVVRRFDGSTYKYYLSDGAREARDELEIQRAEIEFHMYMAQRMSQAEREHNSY